MLLEIGMHTAAEACNIKMQFIYTLLHLISQLLTSYCPDKAQKKKWKEQYIFHAGTFVLFTHK